MAGLLSEGPEQRQPQQLRLGDYVLYVTYERPNVTASAQQNPGVQATTSPSSTVTGGLVIELGPNEFVFAGTGLTVTFDVETPGDPLVGILSVDEGEYRNGQWQQGRRLNGDQTHQGRRLRLPPGHFGIQRIKLYRYK
jgi:beta-galactosidase GanA